MHPDSGFSQDILTTQPMPIIRPDSIPSARKESHLFFGFFSMLISYTFYAKYADGSPSFTARICSGAWRSGSRKPPSMQAELQNANMDG